MKKYGGVSMACPDCGKEMHKRNYKRMFDSTRSVYQWMCSGFPKCDKRVYVDANGNPCTKTAWKRSV